MFNTNQASVSVNMKDKILAIIHAKGPVIPKDLTKQLKLDTVFAGAHLSELVANKKLLVSTAKIGGSPVYYLPDDKEKLQLLYNYMNEKDKAAFDMLKQHKILRDIEQTPLIRVALRTLKDFSVSLTVNLPSGQETFWKWYLTTKDEAEHLIKSKMNLLPEQQHSSPKLLHEEHEAHRAKIDADKQRIEHEKKRFEEEKKQVEEERFLFEQEKQQLSRQRQELESLKQKEELLKHKEEIERLTAPIKTHTESAQLKKSEEPLIEQLIPEKYLEPAPEGQTTKKHGRKPKTVTQEKISPEKNMIKLKQPTEIKLPFTKLNLQTQLAATTQETKSIHIQITELNDNFLNFLKSYFDAKQIKINTFNLNRKNSDFDLMVSVPTPVGNIQYFCSAKNKQKCNEGDISAAFVQAQSKKLPLLFLSTGELTKKAALMLDNEFKNQVSYQKLNL